MSYLRGWTVGEREESKEDDHLGVVWIKVNAERIRVATKSNKAVCKNRAHDETQLQRSKGKFAGISRCSALRGLRGGHVDGVLKLDTRRTVASIRFLKLAWPNRTDGRTNGSFRDTYVIDDPTAASKFVRNIGLAHSL